MLNCAEWEELNTRYRIATLRQGRFVDSLAGLQKTGRDDQEVCELQNDTQEALRALQKHENEHGCRG